MVITFKTDDSKVTLLPTLDYTEPILFRGLAVRCRQISGSIRIDMGDGNVLVVKPGQWLCRIEGSTTFFTLDDDLYRILTLSEEMPSS